MPRTIPALSLLQPWASLVAVGAKRLETRSWATRHRGLLAIHASKGFPRNCREFAAQAADAEYLSAATLPFGKVVAVCRVVECRSTNDRRWVTRLPYSEAVFGDYSPNRHGWVLEDVRALPEPVEAKGALSLWQWEVPDALWEQLGLEELAAKVTDPPLGGLFATAAG